MNLSSLRLVVLIGLSLTLLNGCTRHVYGVHEGDRRHSERTDIIIDHQEHRRAYPRVIYLRLSGGSFYFRGRPYHYHQHALQLRQGETRTITLISIGGEPVHRIQISVRYLNGNVMLGDGRRFLHTLNYRDAWHQGDHYRGIKLRGGIRLEGMDIAIGSKPLKRQKGQDRVESECRGRECTTEDNGSKHKRDSIERDERKRARDEQRKADNERRKAERDEKARLRQERENQEKARKEQARQEKAKQEKLKREEQRKADNERRKAERAEKSRVRQERKNQEKAGREKARQEKARQEKAKQEKAKQEKAKQEKAKNNENDTEECVERGKNRGKRSNGLPYCDE